VAAVSAAGDAPEVVVEATYGWYWAVDVLQELGATVHLANPNALNWGERRVKNDVVDATDLADMLRLGRLPEAWIAPPALRELRELVRYRHLCRRRHRCRYAEDRIMPRIRPRACWRVVTGSRRSA
jgi:transposase